MFENHALPENTEDHKDLYMFAMGIEICQQLPWKCEAAMAFS